LIHEQAALMSRAFIRESDQDTQTLADRPISDQPNFVTPRGLRQIEAQTRDLHMQRQAARAAEDTASLARIERDLRYWTQRRASARVVEPTASVAAVRFGVRVTIQLETGVERTFRLVGEDEADPTHGLLSWVSPLAQSLLGRTEGDTVRFQDSDAEIVRLEP
jgi:transcription elongation GreA/GreB family factor